MKTATPSRLMKRNRQKKNVPADDSVDVDVPADDSVDDDTAEIQDEQICQQKFGLEVCQKLNGNRTNDAKTIIENGELKEEDSKHICCLCGQLLDALICGWNIFSC